MSAVMTRGEVAAAHRAAVERKEPRRNVYRPYTDAEELQARLDGVTLERLGLYAAEYRDPRSPSEWWDDRIAERNSSHWGFPETPLLFTLAGLLRDGDAGGARAALKAARGLDPAVQWCVYRNLELWRKHESACLFGVERPVDQVIGEWERLRLPTEAPAPAQARRRRPWEITESEATA